MEFEKQLKERAARVDGLLRSAPATWLDEVGGATTDLDLAKATEVALLAGGKRLRPIFVLETARFCGGEEIYEKPDSIAVRSAVAIEAIHCFSLVHDDLPALDNADERRGAASLHKRFDEATALLAGDLLLLHAIAYLRDSVEQARILNAATAAMIIGQGRESERPPKREEEWLAIAQGKTCALFRAACELGAMSGGVSGNTSAPVVALFAEFGRNFGICYQLLDDLQDFAEEQQDSPSLNFAVLFGRARAQALLRERLAHARQNLSLIEAETKTSPKFHQASLTWLEEKATAS